MRIYTDTNGVAVNAIHSLSDGTVVEGHEYQVLSGSKTTSLSFQRGGVAANALERIHETDVQSRTRNECFASNERIAKAWTASDKPMQYATVHLTDCSWR